MKRSTVVILVVVGVVLVLFFWFKNGYNSMVKEQEGVQTAWSQVENVYQRRADLIPNLVNTVKGYAAHESQTLEGVVNARAKATQLTVDPENLTPEKLAAYQEAQGELGAALAIQENYPDLKANENFLALQSQLEGTENRISTERMKFNEAAKRYNVLIRVFPKSIIASLFGFEKMPYFQAKEGADVAPAVEF